jgi:hypothetical protein
MPLLGSRGGGSIRGFGRFGKSLILSLVDTFNRANGPLGTSSDGQSVWFVLRGNFSIDSNRAYSTDTGNSLATVLMDSDVIVNAEANMHNNEGGVGLAFWVTDANSWWSIYPGYESTTTSSTSTSCSGNVYIGFGIQNTPADACNRACGDISVTAYCEDGGQFATAAMVYNSCSLPSQQRQEAASYCEAITGSRGNYLVCTGGNCYAGQTVTTTTSTTTVESSINIRNENGVQHKNVYSTSSSSSPTNSIAISTVGNVITYSAYSAVDKGGSIRTASTYTPTSPTKGKRFGIFKTASQSSQGSYIDGLNVTVI